jgi:hypothetical protein
MIPFFENNKWIVGWTNEGKTRIRIQSKEDKGFATAYMVGKSLSYDDMDMWRRYPRIEYINGDIVPTYIRAKVSSAFSMGMRWR